MQTYKKVIDQPLKNLVSLKHKSSQNIYIHNK